MKELADLLTKAADIARRDGQTWLVSRIGADLLRLDALERARKKVCPITSADASADAPAAEGGGA